MDKTIYNCIRVEYPDIPFFPGENNQRKIPAAWLIEKTGWKGKRRGNVGTWPTQALVMINGPFGLARAKALARELRSVEYADGIELVKAAYRRAFGRAPTEEEAQAVARFLANGASHNARRSALLSPCHATR